VIFLKKKNKPIKPNDMNIYEALAEINKKVDPIKKDKQNTQQNFKYRGIDQVMNELHKLFAEYGVIITSDIVGAVREERTTSKGTLMIYSIIDYKFTLTATDGTFITTTVRGEANDSGDKSSNKSYAVAMKYALLGMFLIPTEEMKDPDAEQETPQSPVVPSKPELKPEDKAMWDKFVTAMKGGCTIEQFRTKWTISDTTAELLAMDAKEVKPINK
jgi:hypothetical protein